MISEATPYAAINALLAALHGRLAATLGPLYSGLALHGSLAESARLAA